MPESIYSDPLHYDAKYSNLVDDIPFYYGRALEYGGPVLELACGTGRITIPLAKQGVDITGIDLSQDMLSGARKKAAEGLDIKFIRADCRDFDLHKKFRLIFFPFNSICHLHERAELESCLDSVRRHLANEGAFIIDVFNPDLDWLTGGDEEFLALKYRDPYGSGVVEVMETYAYDRATQIKRIRWRHVSAGGELVQELTQRIYFPRELDELLYYNGFRIKDKYGHYDGRPFKDDSPKQVIVSSPA